MLCTASLEEKGPPWLRGTGKGWVTAEYAMLPRATHERTRREVNSGKPSGRTQEIQRLIGRSLRAVVNLPAIGERQIVVDCDVIQADGGTRTASITGAWVALHECFAWMQNRSIISINPLREPVAAISCGIYQGKPVLDLDYAEDSAAETDANFVITGSGGIVEVQGTAEGKPFSEEEFLSLLRLAKAGVAQLVDLQKKAVAVSHAPPPDRQGRHRHPQCGQAARDAGAARRPSGWRPCRPASSACRCRPRRATCSPRTPPSRPMRPRKATGLPALSDDSGPLRRCARRRAGPVHGRLGRAEAGFSCRHGAGRARACRSAACRDGNRKAHFVSALVIAWPDGHEELFEGRVFGQVVWPPRGDEGFRLRSRCSSPTASTETFGEISSEREARHRLVEAGARRRCRTGPGPS